MKSEDFFGTFLFFIFYLLLFHNCICISECLHNQKLKHVQREIDTCSNSDKVSTQNARKNTGKGNNANMRGKINMIYFNSLQISVKRFK